MYPCKTVVFSCKMYMHDLFASLLSLPSDNEEEDLVLKAAVEPKTTPGDQESDQKTKDDLLTYGYIRELEKTYGGNMPPDLKKLTHEFYFVQPQVTMQINLEHKIAGELRTKLGRAGRKL
eukprot:260731_1